MFSSRNSFFHQILINMLFISFEISSHFSCLLPALSLSILFTSMLIFFIFKRLLIIECCLELLRLDLRLELLLRRLLRLRNCRIDPCGESCCDAVHVLCADFLLQELSHLHCLSALRCHVRADALDLGCLVLDVRSDCFLLMVIPSACSCWTTALDLGCFGTDCSFLSDVCRIVRCGAFSIFVLFTLFLSYCSVSLDCEVHVLMIIIISCSWTSVAVLTMESSSFNLDSNIRLFFRLSLSLLDLFRLSRVADFLASSSSSLHRCHRRCQLAPLRRTMNTFSRETYVCRGLCFTSSNVLHI